MNYVAALLGEATVFSLGLIIFGGAAVPIMLFIFGGDVVVGVLCGLKATPR